MTEELFAPTEPGKSNLEEKPLRCACNKLLCIVKGDNVEIRCNKCKRYTLIRTEGIVSVERGDEPFTAE